MKWFLSVLVSLALLAGISGCGSSGHSANPPTDLAATAGDGRVTLTWTMEPDVQYWAYYGPATSISVNNWTTIANSHALMNVSSPLVVSGLTNDTTYAFTMDARVNAGPRGDGAPSITSLPRLAGSTWETGTAIGSSDLMSATYGTTGTGVFVTVGAGGTIATSTDGASWAAVTNSVSSANLNAVVFGGSTYVAAGAGGAILYSTDTVTWVAETSATSNAINGLASNGSNQFVGVGAGGTIVYSGNGTSWSAASSGTTSDLLAVGYGNGVYIAVGSGGTLLTSSDGVNWTARASNTSANLTGVTYGTNATSATTLYLAVGASGTVLTSSDAITWTASNSLFAGNINSVAYATQFMLVGDAGAIYSSTTGSTWTAQTSGTTANLYGVGRSPFSYVAVGAGGTHLLAR
jgi:hypothetical protein